MKHRDFKVKGCEFYLNDNFRHNEYEGRYTLLMHRPTLGWTAIGTVSSKLEARAVALAYVS